MGSPPQRPSTPTASTPTQVTLLAAGREGSVAFPLGMGMLPTPGTCRMNQLCADTHRNPSSSHGIAASASLVMLSAPTKWQGAALPLCGGAWPRALSCGNGSPLGFSGLFSLPSPFFSLPSSKPYGGRSPPASLRRHAALCRSQTLLCTSHLSPLFAPHPYFCGG